VKSYVRSIPSEMRDMVSQNAKIAFLPLPSSMIGLSPLDSALEKGE
jgi:hypothetical protein